MLQTLVSTAQRAVIERAVLFVNHLLAAEPVALHRLRPHAGRCMTLQVDGWPALLPALPRLDFRVTPAGLVEWCGAEAPVQVDLVVRIDAADPARLMARWARGERPRIDIQGDSQFAADCDWLLANVRWDAEDDLARFVGPAPARVAAQAGTVLAGSLRSAARGIARWADRFDAGGGADDASGSRRPGAR